MNFKMGTNKYMKVPFSKDFFLQVFCHTSAKTLDRLVHSGHLSTYGLAYYVVASAVVILDQDLGHLYVHAICTPAL